MTNSPHAPAPGPAAGPPEAPADALEGPRAESLERVHRTLEMFLAATRSTKLHRELSLRAGGSLTRTEAFVLGHIVSYGPLRLSDLAESTGQDRSITSRQVDTLMRAGLVERTKDPADGRAWLIGVTDAGLRLSRAMRGVWSRWLQEALGGWSDEDLEQLAVMMSRFGQDLRSPRG